MLKFKSGFESPVIVEHPNLRNAYLSGGDVAGFNWDNLCHMFNYTVNGYPDQVDTQITTLRAHSGARSLYGVVKLENYPLRHQINLYMHDFTSDATYGKGVPIIQNMLKTYIRYWMFIPSSFDLADGGWNNIFEDVAYGAPNTSIPLHIYRNNHVSPNLYWHLRRRLYQEPYTTYWSLDNLTVPVPLGKWFKFESYIERHPTTGVIRFWIDGSPIFNVENIPSKVEGSDEHFAIIFKQYGGFSYFPVETWYDDLEIWDGLPTPLPQHALSISSEPTNIPFDIRRI